ncbi:MAG: tetrahydrofolate dehydrogenase/cyclohydrolase catalytic domain-containing protein [Candidatus Saccharimonadales bacterium]
MKLLNGQDLANYIQERQTREVQVLRQTWHIVPKLAIIQMTDNPIITTYVNLKKRYGVDISIDVAVHRVSQTETPKLIEQLNGDTSVHGIIVQLPLEDPSQTDEIVNLVAPDKDVDALGKSAQFDPATPMAIMWLLAGYNIDLLGKKILLIGRGKLVGAPLERVLKASGLDVETVGREVNDLSSHTKNADIIITATGSPAILLANMIKEKAIVVDAGVASESGKMIGDLAPDVYEREDLTVTPKRGGVGPLTICALSENVIKAASRVATKQTEIG